MSTKETIKQVAHAEIKIESTENILKINPAEQILAAGAGYPGKPPCIIFSPLGRIRKDRISLGNLLNPNIS
jgi:hypothetical protein